MFIKFSVGIFLLRLTTSRAYAWTIYISLAVIAIWTIVLSFWNLFQCSPVAGQWDYTIPGHTCVSPAQVVQAAYALSVMIILSDWLYALLPVPMVWKVKMTTPAKISVVLLLGLGILCGRDPPALLSNCQTGLTCFYLVPASPHLYGSSFWRISKNLTTSSVRGMCSPRPQQGPSSPGPLLTRPGTVDGTDAMVWTLVEPGIAIIAASLVTIRPLLRLMRLRGFGTTDRTFGYSGTAYSGTQRLASRMPGYGPGNIKMVDMFDAEDHKQHQHQPLPRPPPPDSKLGGSILVHPHVSPLAMSPYLPSAAAQTHLPAERLGCGHQRLDATPPRGLGDFDDETRRLQPPGVLGRQRSEVNSETYVIEGARLGRPGTPSRRSRSPSISSFDMVGTEADGRHAQHHTRGMV